MEMTFNGTTRALGLPSAVIAGLVVFSFFAPTFWLSLFITIFFGIIAASGLRFCMMTGQLNIAQSAFAAIGAYTSTLLVMKLGAPFLTALIAAGLMGALAGLLLGLAFARSRGVYYAMASMILVEAVRNTISLARPLTQGSSGIFSIPPPQLATLSLKSVEAQFLFGVCLVAICLAIMYAVERSRLGITWKAIGRNEDLAKAVGINTYKHMVMAFVFSSFFGGIAGSYYAHTVTFISPEAGFGILNSVVIFMYVLIGGQARFIGPVVGATFLVLLSEPFRGLSQYEMLFFSISIMVVVIFIPGGLITLPTRLSKARDLLLRRPKAHRV